jgi:hypothetical protein
MTEAGGQLPVIVGFVPLLNPNHLLGREVMRAIDLRIFRISPDGWIYVVVSPTLTTLGEQRCYNTKTPECRSCEVMWVIDLRILRDPSRPFDHGDVCIMSRARGGPRVEK